MTINLADCKLQNPSHIHADHWAELIASGIDPEIASRNFFTIEDPAEVDRLLNRNSDKRWKHSSDLVPGWAVRGIDPETGEHTSLGAQYKPDRPRVGDNDKPRKYENALDYPTTPLFLDPVKANFWLKVLQDLRIAVIITEGAKKAAAGLSAGLATISIAGVATGQKLGELKSELKQFCQIGRTIHLAFDADLMTNPQVCKALDQLGRLIAAEGAVVKIILLPGPEKGMDDFIAARGKDAFCTLVENAVSLEKWRKEQQEKLGNVLLHPTRLRTLLSTEQLKTEIDELLDQDLPQSELEAIVPELARRSERQSKDVLALIRAKEKEREQALEKTEAIAKDLPSLMEVKRQRLNLLDFLWGDGGQLARQLIETAKAMPTAPEFLLTTLIAAAGSRIGAGTRIVIKGSGKRKGNGQYTQPGIFRTMIVAPTGAKKTPAQRVIIDPLDELEAEEYQKWDVAQREYESKLAAYSKGKQKDAELPAPPAPRKRRIVTDATIEARARIHHENPRGFLIYRDEGAAHFTSRDKYRNKASDETEIELSEFNGGPLSKDRAKDSIFVPCTAISRTGSIQWETLKSHMKGHEDHTGEWARWLLCAAPAPASKIDLLSEDADLDTGVDEALKTLYQRLEQVEPANYLLSREAKVIFQEYQHMLIEWQREEDHSGLQNAYPKFESYLARLALWLHVVNAALSGVQPETLISDATMAQAVALIDYFIGQLRLIYAQNSPTSELTGIVLQMQNFAERKGVELAVRDFQSGLRVVRDAKLKKPELLGYMKMLAEIGYGELRGDKYLAKSADTLLTENQQSESSSLKVVQTPADSTDSHSSKADIDQASTSVVVPKTAISKRENSADTLALVEQTASIGNSC